MPQVPDALWQLLQDCWATAPGRRPTMKQVADRLTKGLLQDVRQEVRQVLQPKERSRETASSSLPAPTQVRWTDESAAASLLEDDLDGDSEHSWGYASLEPSIAPPSQNSSDGRRGETFPRAAQPIGKYLNLNSRDSV